MQEVKNKNVVLADYREELAIRLNKVQKDLSTAEKRMMDKPTTENIRIVHGLRITLDTVREKIKRAEGVKPDVAMDSIYLPQQI